MGYAKIVNAYRGEAAPIFLFKEVYALEKIHGSSSHIAWHDGIVTYFSGGEKHERFVALFDHEALVAAFTALGHTNVTVYGEVYGGSMQGMAKRYGPKLRFVAFEVFIGAEGGTGGTWLNVPNAADVVAKVGLEFVHYRLVSTDLPTLDAERDAPSEQARRNGVEGDQPREGVVLRPPLEFSCNGARVMVKHKRAEERETATPRNIDDPAVKAAYDTAQAVAEEYVVPMRLVHVLQKLPQDIAIEGTGKVVKAMVDDILVECAGEFTDTKEVRTAIGKRAAALFHAHLRASIPVP